MLAASLVFALAMSSLPSWFELPSAALGAAWTRWLDLVAASLAGCAVVDASFARAAFFRSLWLTRREQLDELREAHGAPETRRARALARASATNPGSRAHHEAN
jgi:flagellar biosynthesis protein FlhB